MLILVELKISRPYFVWLMFSIVKMDCI